MNICGTRYASNCTIFGDFFIASLLVADLPYSKCIDS